MGLVVEPSLGRSVRRENLEQRRSRRHRRPQQTAWGVAVRAMRRLDESQRGGRTLHPKQEAAAEGVGGGGAGAGSGAPGVEGADDGGAGGETNALDWVGTVVSTVEPAVPFEPPTKVRPPTTAATTTSRTTAAITAGRRSRPPREAPATGDPDHG